MLVNILVYMTKMDKKDVKKVKKLAYVNKVLKNLNQPAFLQKSKAEDIVRVYNTQQRLKENIMINKTSLVNRKIEICYNPGG